LEELQQSQSGLASREASDMLINGTAETLEPRRTSCGRSPKP
jgi:hypothetical protein